MEEALNSGQRLDGRAAQLYLTWNLPLHLFLGSPYLASAGTVLLPLS